MNMKIPWSTPLCFLWLLFSLTTSSPQTKLVSLPPANPIDPVQNWVWGRLGNGRVYIATQTWGGGEVSQEEKGIVPTSMENEEELAIAVELEASENNLNGVSQKKEGIVPPNMENEEELAIDVELEASESNSNEENYLDTLSPETAIDIEFPDAVTSIKPLDTNFLKEEGDGIATWPKTGGDGGFSSWPKEPVIENNYKSKGQLINLDATMKAYKIGSGSKMVVWGHDIYGLTGENSDNGRTKEWADFLAENGYNVLVPDWFRGNNLPGGTFGPSTPAWMTSVTNWTNIESDWTNVILPYIQKESPSSIGMIGTCWGSYPVIRLSMFDTISAGVSMHPSHDKLLAAAGEDEAEVLGRIKSPHLFLVEGEAGESVKTGGLSEKVLGDKLTVVEFPDMKHGWTMRGDLADQDIARDVLKAKQLALQFFENNLTGGETIAKYYP